MQIFTCKMAVILSRPQYVNPLRSELFQAHINICLYFLLLLDTEMAHVEIPPDYGRRRTVWWRVIRHSCRCRCVIHSVLPEYTYLYIRSFNTALQWRRSWWARWRLKSPNLDCLLNRLFRCKSKKTSKLRVTALCEGNPSVDSPHKASVMGKMFPFDDVIMGTW